MSRFVQVGTKRLPIDDDWIEIKNLLTVGEQKRVDTSGLKKISTGATKGESPDIVVDFAEFSFARTLAYLTNWSFTDDKGVGVKVSRAAVEALDGETYAKIEAAITAHVEGLAEAKKNPAGTQRPEAN